MLALGLGDYGSDDEEDMQETVVEAAALATVEAASTVHISTSVTTLLRGYSDAGPDGGGITAFGGFPTDAAMLGSPAERITTAVTTVEYTATTTVTATTAAHMSSPSPAPSGPVASHFHQHFNAAPSPGPSPAPAAPPQTGMQDSASVDPFSLLPPELIESPGPCPPALQDQFRRYLDKQRSTNKTINDELRKSRAYKNPDLLQKLVEHFKIKECGSAFRPEVFDPDALPAEDYIDALIKQMDTDQVRKAQERSSREVAARSVAGGAAAGARGVEFTKGTSSSSLQAVGSATDMYRASQAAMQLAAKIAKTKWDAK